MKIQLVTVLSIILGVMLPAQAQKRSYTDAAKVAEAFFQTTSNSVTIAALQQKDGTRKSCNKLRKVAQSKVNRSYQAYYMFANEANQQLIIVSGDERMHRILGYTDHAFSGETLPAGMADLLDAYQAQYSALPPSVATHSKTRAALYKGERLLQTAAWGQGTPFNQMIPQAYPTGCAATAMAIVMRYHQWPKVGVGNKTHIWKDSVMTANFGQTHYEWENMPLTYNNYDVVQAKAVALLMRHAGISVEMYYDAESSGARQTLVPGALSQYFRYASTARLLTAKDYDVATWDEMMRHEIDEGRPVLYTGESTQGRGSHGFVLDGYRDNLFHFNFGWNGNGNGYFAISALSSTDQSFEFSNKQQAVVGIKPLKEDDCAPLTLECKPTYEGFYTSLTTLAVGTSVPVHLSNLTALRTWKGKIAWQLCHADGTKSELLGVQEISLSGGSSQAFDFELNGSVAAVKGDYLQLVACEENATQWRTVLNALGKEVQLAAYERKVPVVNVTHELKHATIDDNANENIRFEGKPLLGSKYKYKVVFDKDTQKTLVQTRKSCESYHLNAEESVIELTADSLYIKAKGYLENELINQCTVSVDSEGRLYTALQRVTNDADAIEALTIEGHLNNNDLQLLSSLQSLKRLDIENTTIEQGLFGAPFKDFKRLTHCQLPRSLKQLGSETFKNCVALKTLSLPVSLQETGSDLLNGCQSLTDIYVYPSSPNCVAVDAFTHLPRPENVTIHVQQGLSEAFKGNAKWSTFSKFVDDLPALPQKFSYDGIEYNAIYQGDGNYAEVTFPSGQMYTGDITIPATITYQGIDYIVSGFDNTDGLSPFVGNPFITSLNLQLQVEHLRPRQFMGCTNLSTLQLPSTLRSIGSECFRNCPMLMQITLPASVESLEDNAFCGCQYLTDIYSYAALPPSGSNSDDYPFAQCRPQNVTLHVPASCEYIYSTSGFWSKFANIVGDLPAVPTAIKEVTQQRSIFPIKVAGKQKLTLHLDKPQRVALYRLDGTLQRTILLPQGISSIWIEEPGVLKGM